MQNPPLDSGTWWPWPVSSGYGLTEPPGWLDFSLHSALNTLRMKDSRKRYWICHYLYIYIYNEEKGMAEARIRVPKERRLCLDTKLIKFPSTHTALFEVAQMLSVCAALSARLRVIA